MIISSESRTSNFCYKMAQYSQYLAVGVDAEWERKYHVTTGITFIAFSTEAMMNHYGFKLFNDWNDKERNRNRYENHKIVFKEVGLENYIVSDNYKIISNCIQLRDSIAHGKTVNEKIPIGKEKILNISREEKIHTIINYPSNFESELTIENLNLFIDSLNNIENDIENKSGLGEYPLAVSGVREW